MNYELAGAQANAPKSLLRLVTGCRVKPGMTALNNKMQKINRPLNAFWSVIFLITPVICQQVMCMCFKINTLKIAKNEKTERSGQNAQNGVFGNLSDRNTQKGGFGESNRRGRKGFAELAKKNSTFPSERHGRAGFAVLPFLFL